MPLAQHSKIASLKLAAKDLIDIVVWDNQTDDYYAKVAIVPYAAGVNAGGSIANTVRGLISVGCFLLGCDKFTFPTASGGSKPILSALVCVGTDGFTSFTDAAPSLLALVGPNYAPPATPARRIRSHR